MTSKLMGLFASVALMGSGLALANDQAKQHDTQSQSQGATGGSGSMGSDKSGSTQGSDIGGSGTGSQVGAGSQVGSGTQVGQSGMTNQLSGNQLTGRVVKSDRKMVWVDHQGAIVPLKIDKNTQFTDPSLKRAQDLREGDEIRASFEVRKTDNVATSIEKSTNAGTGGAGSDVMKPDQGINQPSDTLPPSKDSTGTGSDINNPGTGGSGSDVGTGTGSDTSVSPDSSQGQNKTSGDF